MKFNIRNEHGGYPLPVVPAELAAQAPGPQKFAAALAWLDAQVARASAYRTELAWRANAADCSPCMRDVYRAYAEWLARHVEKLSAYRAELAEAGEIIFAAIELATEDASSEAVAA